MRAKLRQAIVADLVRFIAFPKTEISTLAGQHAPSPSVVRFLEIGAPREATSTTPRCF
jgi:hypothetical protein